jgi:SagB-type dehydrogenase family enzyme
LAAWREYHELTKHTPERLRALPHVLDWANMPEPFRYYEGAPIVDLPANAPAPSVSIGDVLSGKFPPPTEVDLLTLLSQILFHSAAISATKIVPHSGYRYALRVNPSSGNLHPTEFHVATPSELYHYRASAHDLELRARGDFTQGMGGVVFYLTSIFWREAWKYRQRAYRYCLLDLGHAWEALALASGACGYQLDAVGEFDDNAVAELLRLPPDEAPLLIAPLSMPPVVPPHQTKEWYPAVPNTLSSEVVEYPAIDRVHSATKARCPNPLRSGSVPYPGEFGGEGLNERFTDVVRRRRSALDFLPDRRLTREQFDTLLASALQPRRADFASGFVTLYAYVHQVESLTPGLYRCLPGAVELLEAGDCRVIAAALSLQQELAGNACVAFSMVADLEGATARWGERGYRYAFFEAGAIGQRLYITAEALGFQSTGIGAFFDDAVHRYLKLAPGQGQVIYHFASGYAVKDRRLTEK